MLLLQGKQSLQTAWVKEWMYSQVFDVGRVWRLPKLQLLFPLGVCRSTGCPLIQSCLTGLNFLSVFSLDLTACKSDNLQTRRPFGDRITKCLFIFYPPPNDFLPLLSGFLKYGQNSSVQDDVFSFSTLLKKSSLSNYALKIFLHMNDDSNVCVFALVAAKHSLAIPPYKYTGINIRYNLVAKAEKKEFPGALSLCLDAEFFRKGRRGTLGMWVWWIRAVRFKSLPPHSVWHSQWPLTNENFLLVLVSLRRPFIMQRWYAASLLDTTQGVEQFSEAC